MDARMVTDWEIESDPIMMRLAVLARENGWANACLNSYRAGFVTRDEALIECIENMAGDNKRLFDMVNRLMAHEPPPPMVVKFESEEKAREALERLRK
jgi:hypothetical protein